MFMKNNLKKIYNKTNKFYPFLLLFVVMIFIHFFMIKVVDDIIFSNALNDKSYLEFIKFRYYNWTGRMIIESLEVLFCKINIIYWKILDSLIMTFIAYIISIIFNINKDKKINYLIVLCIFLYDIVAFLDAGFISTSINFTWIFASALIWFIPILKKYRNENCSWLIYIIGIIFLVIARDQEQMCIILFMLNIFILLFDLYKNNKISKYNIISFIICIMGLIYIFMNPGNSARSNKLITESFKEYKNYNIFAKSYVGLISTFAYYFKNQIIIALISVLIYLNALKNNKISQFSFIIMSLILSMTIFYPLVVNIFPKIKFIIFDLSRTNMLLENFGIRNILTIIFLVVILLSLFILLVIIDKKNKTYNSLLFVLGFVSKFVMGFTASVFSSSDRTAFFCNALWIMIIISLYNSLSNSTIKKYIFNIICIIAILSYFNNFYQILI